MKPDLEQIAEDLARAAQFCDAIPLDAPIDEHGRVGGDLRRLLVPHIRARIDLVPGEVRLLSTPGLSQSMREDSVARLHTMIGDINALVRQAQQFPLAQEIGRREASAQRGRKAGGRTTGDFNIEIGDQTRDKVKKEADRLHAIRTPDHKLASEIAKVVPITTTQIRAHLRALGYLSKKRK